MAPLYAVVHSVYVCDGRGSSVLESLVDLDEVEVCDLDASLFSFSLPIPSSCLCQSWGV